MDTSVEWGKRNEVITNTSISLWQDVWNGWRKALAIVDPAITQKHEWKTKHLLPEMAINQRAQSPPGTPPTAFSFLLNTIEMIMKCNHISFTYTYRSSWKKNSHVPPFTEHMFSIPLPIAAWLHGNHEETTKTEASYCVTLAVELTMITFSVWLKEMIYLSMGWDMTWIISLERWKTFKLFFT